MASYAPSTAPIRSSILWRMISQALVLTTFIIVVLTTLSFIISRTLLERTVRSQLSSVAAIAENAIESTLSAHRERASLLTSHADIRAILSGGGASDTLLRLFTTVRRDQLSLIGMDVFDEKATLLASAGESVHVLPPQSLRIPFHRSVVTDTGWAYYDVFTPVWDARGERIGYLALRYTMDTGIAPLLAVVPSLGETAEVVFSWRKEGVLRVIHPSLDPAQSYVLTPSEQPEDSVLLHALSGAEAVERTNDYRGHDALVAYRYLPALGWGLFVQVDRREALQEVRRLAVAHAAIGTLLLVLAVALASLLANQVTHPLRHLTERVSHLRPGAWVIKRSVRTGDEVEVLDQVVVNMASRLKQVYEKQEQIIDDRTKELKRQYALDRTILDSIGYGVVTVDRKGNVTGANPAALSILSFSKETILGKDIAQAVQLCGHRGNLLEGSHPVRECLRSRRVVRSPVNKHVNMRRNDGSLLAISYAVSPLIANNAMFGAIIVFQDVTEERRLDYLKSEFIELASHQLRTPLSALRWYTELFIEQKKNLNDDQRGFLREMQHSIVRMVALLNSLLHAAHLEGDNLKPEIRKTDVSQLMRELNEDCRSLARDAGLTCKLNVAGKAITAETDETLLRIVLQNLLSNAVKYSEKGSKRAVTFDVSQNKNSVLIAVKDEGMGIPKNEQRRVFQKFFRAKNVRKRDTDGNGLGLYITRTIVERLGGTIDFTSTENKGTTFMVKLPKKAKKSKSS